MHCPGMITGSGRRPYRHLTKVGCSTMVLLGMLASVLNTFVFEGTYRTVDKTSSCKMQANDYIPMQLVIKVMIMI